MRRSFLVLLFAVAAWDRAVAEERISYEIRLLRAGSSDPVPGIRVRLDDRIAWSDTTGTARFEILRSAPTRIVVDSPDHERVEREAGPPGSVEISLVPREACKVAFRCALAGGGEPVPCAHVRLRRTDTGFAVGILDGWADFDGVLAFPEVPQGAYAVEADAPGCEPIRSEVTATKGGLVETLGFEPAAKPIRIVGRARPGATIRALRAAGDELAATQPAARCDAAGDFVLELPASSRGPGAMPLRIALEARAEGFLDTLVPVELSDLRGPVTVPMAPARAVTAETEPNGTAATATPAPRETELRFQIEPEGDVDAFAVDLDAPGLLSLEWETLPCSLTIRLLEDLDGRGAARADRSFFAGRPGKTEFDLRRGRHALAFQGWGAGQHSQRTVSVRLAFAPALDPSERNDEPATAAPSALGTETLGSIFPSGDVDVHRIRVETAGTLRLSVSPPPIGMSWRVRDARGVQLAAVDHFAARSAVVLARLPGGGSYFVSGQAWTAGERSTVPYRMRLDFAPDDAGAGARPLELPLDGVVSGTINPLGDKDPWKLVVPISGSLRVRLSPLPIGTTARVLGPAGEQLSETSAFGDRANESVASLQRPGTYTVEASAWGDNLDSPLPYLLSVAFFPNDSRDARRNDTLPTSSRVRLSRTITGALATIGDRDVYRFQLPRRGLLEATTPVFTLATNLRLWGPEEKELAVANAFGLREHRLSFHVLEPGTHWLSIEEWGNKAWSADRYRLRIAFEPEDPLEPNDAATRATSLPPGTALPGTILPAGDVDRYRIVFPAPGAYRLHLRGRSIGRTLRLVGEGGKPLWSIDRFPEDVTTHAWKQPAPGVAILEVMGWGAGQASPLRHVLWVAGDGAAPPPLVRLSASRGASGTAVRFRAEVEGEAGEVWLDVNGDGRLDRRLEAGAEEEVEYARGGVYPALARATGPTGEGWDFVWADARDPADEAQLAVEFLEPPPDALLEADTAVALDAWAEDGSAVADVEVRVDGLLIGRFGRTPCEAPIEVGPIAGRSVEVVAVARSAGGAVAEARLPLRSSPLVNLSPPDGTRITSGAVVFEWATRESGPSVVTLSSPGVPPRTIEGSAGAVHRVAVEGLEPGREYVWQARTGPLEAPPRTLSVVRGIEFAERRFEATVDRDYDQRAVVRVVHHGLAAATVALHVASEQGDLLVGFVGEGSQDTSISLEPGEYRDVLLGIAAQDAIEERYSFHVSLEGTLGAETHRDFAPVEVTVRMPKIDFDVVVSGPEDGTLARSVEVINKADTVTDLEATFASSTPETARVSPAIRHVRLERGARVEFRVEPVLSVDFTRLEGTLVVRGIHVRKEVPLEFAVPPGQRMFLATVGCGQDNKAGAWFCTNRPTVQTPIPVAPGPQIGTPLTVAPLPRPQPAPPPAPARSWRDRIEDADFFLEDAIAELKKITDPDPCVEARKRADLANEMINRRVSTFNSCWGLVRQTFNFWDPGDLTARVDAVRRAGTPDGGVDLARLAWAYEAAACEEHGNIMTELLAGSGVSRDLLTMLRSKVGSGGHVYVGVCLQKGADYDRPWTWGPGAFVADSWSGRNFTPQEAWGEGWIFNHGDSDASPAKGHGSRHWYRVFRDRGPDYVSARLDQFRQLVPADMRDGDRLLPGADVPPPGWLEGGAR